MAIDKYVTSAESAIKSDEKPHNYDRIIIIVIRKPAKRELGKMN